MNQYVVVNRLLLCFTTWENKQFGLLLIPKVMLRQLHDAAVLFLIWLIFSFLYLPPTFAYHK
jgi:hypothetical protein